MSNKPILVDCTVEIYMIHRSKRKLTHKLLLLQEVFHVLLVSCLLLLWLLPRLLLVTLCCLLLLSGYPRHCCCWLQGSCMLTVLLLLRCLLGMLSLPGEASPGIVAITMTAIASGWCSPTQPVGMTKATSATWGWLKVSCGVRVMVEMPRSGLTAESVVSSLHLLLGRRRGISYAGAGIMGNSLSCLLLISTSRMQEVPTTGSRYSPQLSPTRFWSMIQMVGENEQVLLGYKLIY